MAEDASTPHPSQPAESNPETGNPNPQPTKPDVVSSPPQPQPQPLSTPPPSLQPSPTLNPNPIPAPQLPPPPPSHGAVPINPYAVPPPIGSSAPPPSLPSFRPAGAPIQPQPSISTPQFTPMPQNPNRPNYPQHQLSPAGTPPPGVNPPPGMNHPPGVNHPPGMAPPAPMNMYQMQPAQPPNALPRPPFGVMPNGYAPPGVPPGTIPPPGAPRYPYAPVIRPGFPPRPPGTIGLIPTMSRPPVLGVRPPVVTTANRPPLLTIVTPAEKPQTTVYVGKIASTVEDDFILSLLKFCGAVKSWKRAQDPSNGTPKGFGFCEFESAEGVLRALRLLTKFNVDGQELVLNVNQATRDYLERYVEKKKEELKKAKDTEKEDAKEEEGAANGENREGQENNELVNSTSEDPKKDDNETGDKDNGIASFGLVNDEDREADREASDKINEAINERLKTRPLPPPPPQKPDVVAVSNSEMPARSGDRDSDGDQKKDEKYDEEMSSEVKATSTAGGDSPDRGRRHDSRNRERERERDMKRDKERALEKIERDRERERARKERDREVEILKAERHFKERVKEWESREKDKEYQRKYEKEREKEKERERRRLISDQEDESDDDSRRRRRRSDIEEKRKRRRREKDEDLEDRLREEAEIAEAEKKAAEELERQKEREELQSSAPVANGVEKAVSPENEMDVESNEVEDKGGSEQIFDSDSGQVNHIGDGVLESSSNDETVVLASGSDARAGGNAPAKKLGFGIVGSGKRAAVPSVFNAEDDEDAHKDKKMRPLVPIDYSTEELQAVQNDVPLNLAAAAEFAKRISHANNMKEEKTDVAKDRSRHSQDRSSTHRDRDRRDDGTGSHRRNEGREKSVDREHGDRSKGTENNKIIDAKQLIDMIPKTKDELFSYDVNWTVYDKHGLHDKMRPWISRKITEFLGEEEATLVDYIVSSMQEHVKASQMLELLQSILDEEAEMFVLKMWRMLIFEIKRVETGLVSSKSKP